MISAIMNAPGFAELCFLIAVVLFAVELLLKLKPNASWTHDNVLTIAGFGLIALGLLAL